MKLFSFQLSVFSPVRSISLREMNGHDEQLIYNGSTECALQLIGQLIVQRYPGSTGQQVKAEKIPVADRDYLLAEIYKYTYGAGIESSLNCSACGEKYELSFLLDDLVTHSGNRTNKITADQEGFFCGEAGERFRLPTGEDEIAVMGAAPEEAETIMFNRCVTQTGSVQKNEIMEMMENLGPVLTTDIVVNCPECGTPQSVQFDMQQYLLTKIKNGRRKLAAEVHSIALAYGWSHKEILDLPITMRHTYAGFINNDQ